MVSSKDVFISAHLVIEKCEGHYDPKEYALFRAKTLREEGDNEGAEAWQRIAGAVEELLNQKSKNSIH